MVVEMVEVEELGGRRVHKIAVKEGLEEFQEGGVGGGQEHIQAILVPMQELVVLELGAK